MVPPIPYLSNLGFGAEIIYSFVIIICSLMVYIGTKELYELSSYKGIRYFRQAFLFFAIAYFFRSFIKFITDYFKINQIIDFSPMMLGQFSLLLFIYFSSMAVFYLIYSLMWKKWNGSSKKIYIFHTLALLISIISISLRSSLIYLSLNIFLLLFVIIISFISNREQRRKKNNLHVIYTLLFIFWFFNVIDILVPDFLGNIQLFIYLISSGIFLTILYKVLRKVGS
jgi:hypothetical protein